VGSRNAGGRNAGVEGTAACVQAEGRAKQSLVEKGRRVVLPFLVARGGLENSSACKTKTSNHCVTAHSPPQEMQKSALPAPCPPSTHPGRGRRWLGVRSWSACT